MECFLHSGTVAAGVCVACGRGLCRGCARVDGGTLHCEGDCSEIARCRVQSLADSKKQRAAGRTMLVPIAVIMFLCGAALLILGFFGSFWEQIACIVLGIGVMLFSVLLAVALRPVVRSSAELVGPGPDSPLRH